MQLEVCNIKISGSEIDATEHALKQMIRFYEDSDRYDSDMALTYRYVLAKIKKNTRIEDL